MMPYFFFPDIDHRLELLNGPESGSKPKRRSVRFSEATDLPRPKLSLTILRYILRHPTNKPKVLRKNLDQLRDIKDELRVRKLSLCGRYRPTVSDSVFFSTALTSAG